MDKLLGPNVVNKGGKTVDLASITGEGKYVGLYFSAHWCPPCKAFTPKLVEFYNYMKAKEEGKQFEIVFVSSDRDEESFAEYYDEMPWLALKFSERERKARLSKHFKVHGIPTLIFVDGKTGKPICKEGRQKIMEDESEWDKFPWPPKPFLEMVGGDLLKQDEMVSAADALKGKYVGLYFSAHWCPPCRGFTPDLVKCYNKLVKDGKPFEIVFVSSDRTDDSFKEYYRSMPWLAIPYKKDQRCQELSSTYEVSGIPSLIILDQEGKIVTSQGRTAVTGDPEGKEFPWVPKMLNELTDATATTLNEEACLMLLTDGTADEMSKAKDLLQGVVEKYADKEEELDLFFFYGGDDEICDSLRDFLKLPKDKSLLVIADIQDGKLAVSPVRDAAITEDVITKFVDDYETGALAFASVPGAIGQAAAS